MITLRDLKLLFKSIVRDQLKENYQEGFFLEVDRCSSAEELIDLIREQIVLEDTEILELIVKKIDRG